MIKNILLTLCLLFIVCGCQSKEDQKHNITLRVTQLDKYMSVSNLFEEYQALHPEVEIEFREENNVFENPNKALLENVLASSDIVIAKPHQFQELVKQGKLESLQAKMKKDWKWEHYYPFLKKALQKAGGEEDIYGVMPNFNASTFVCNVSKFKEAGIAIPEKQLTWDEFIALNRELTNKLGRPSLGMDVFNFQMLYAQYLNLNMFNSKNKKIDLNNERWKKVWQHTLDTVDKKIFSSNYSYEPNSVAINMYHFVSYRDDQTKMKAIPMPKLDRYTEINPELELGTLYAITKTSPNQSEAWEVLRHIMKDDTKLGKYEEHFEAKSFKNKTETNITEPFAYGEYAGLIDYIYDTSTSKSVNPNFRDEKFMKQTERLLNEVIQKKITLDEALQMWQEEGQKAVERFEEEQS